MKRESHTESARGAPEEITGPGRTEPIVRPAPPAGGRRLRPQAKGLLLGGAVTLVAAIAGGIALARHAGSRGQRGAVDHARHPEVEVGRAPPPAPPLRVPQGGEAVEAGSLTAPGASLGTEALGASAAEGALPPAMQYREWLVKEHYKTLEGAVQAAQAARAASPAPQGVAVSGEVANGEPGGPLPLSPGRGATGAEGPAGARAYGATSNRRFLAAERRRRTAGVLPHRLHAAVSRHELFAGSVVPAVLLTGIDSDLPGEIVAQVRQDVDNSLNPDEVLIPQGARLVGIYRSEVAYGQRRVLVAWRRILFPDGATLDLAGMPGADGLGRAGFHDQVDNHYLRVFGSAFLISLLGAGAQLAQPQNAGALNTPGAAQQAEANLANEMNSVGANLLNRNLAIQPTLSIRPGYLFNVLVTRTVVLPPYPHRGQHPGVSAP